ncbi:MAG: adenylate/guanylate cyclase domain-containing protein [Planctomycetes bacterium]|nr:adenylate/guanylate cyclase domain-containing protein [Planctomycetota bacterium]MCB9935940.1 adenylate/guanylate cyclase domain-containing protein [Planctomycetota bacterium]
MSLRYKALIAVIVLVAFLTGFLVVSSSSLFEEDARNRILSALFKDQGILDERIQTSARISSTGMKASAASSELVQLFASEEVQNIGDNLLYFARDWRRDADGDIAIAAIDSFVAEDRGANVIGRAGNELAYVAMESAAPVDAATRARLLADPELTGFVSEFYMPAFNAGTAKHLDKDFDAAVLPVAGKVYLVVQSFLWSSIQNKEAVGVGIVLTELSRDWLMRSPGQGAERADDIGKIVFTAEVIASTTLDDAGAAEVVFEDAKELGAVGESGRARPFEFELQGQTHLGIAFSSGLSPKGRPNRPGFIAFKSLDRELESFVLLRQRVFMIGGGLGLIAALLAYFGAYSVISKLRRLQDATGKIREGRFDTRVKIRGHDELAKLGKAFNDMTTGLKALGMYTHDTLAKSLLDNPELLNAPSMRAEGSIFFSDIKGFTSISEGMAAEDLTSQLNEYFAAIGRKLKEQRGYVDKFIGDAIMAFWGPPFSSERDYAVRACESALASLRIASELREQWRQQGKPLFFQRIGIATGEVVIGNIGTDTKKNFTVIGDSVNLASRLEGANKLYLSDILVDERTFELAKQAIAFREIDQIRVVGRQQPVRVFEPRVALTPADEAYAAALKQYRKREFKAAADTLETLLQGTPGDGPAQWLREQCRALQDHLPPDWEPVTTATSK